MTNIYFNPNPPSPPEKESEGQRQAREDRKRVEKKAAFGEVLKPPTPPAQRPPASPAAPRRAGDPPAEQAAQEAPPPSAKKTPGTPGDAQNPGQPGGPTKAAAKQAQAAAPQQTAASPQKAAPQEAQAQPRMGQTSDANQPVQAAVARPSGQSKGEASGQGDAGIGSIDTKQSKAAGASEGTGISGGGGTEASRQPTAAPVATEQAVGQAAKSASSESSGFGQPGQSDRPAGEELGARAKAEGERPMIDLASIVPAFPTPPPPQAAAAMAAGRHVPIDPALLQQIVEFAAVTRNDEGQMEFVLGLDRAALGGLRVRLTACGSKRIKLRFSGAEGGTDTVSEGQISQLLDSLRGRDIEVVDVTTD